MQLITPCISTFCIVTGSLLFTECQTTIAWSLNNLVKYLRKHLSSLYHQSNEVGGSYHMELKGLKRSLKKLAAHGIVLDDIDTDRHPRIQKYQKDNNIKQFYDIWHQEKRSVVDFFLCVWVKQDYMSNYLYNPYYISIYFIFNVSFLNITHF